MARKIFATTLLAILPLQVSHALPQSEDDIRDDLRDFRRQASCDDFKKKGAAKNTECEKDANEILDLVDLPETKAQMEALKKHAAQQRLLEEGRTRANTVSARRQQTLAAEERIEDVRKRERRQWLKFIAVFCAFGLVAKWKGASFLRWGIVGTFAYGTLILAGYLPA